MLCCYIQRWLPVTICWLVSGNWHYSYSRKGSKGKHYFWWVQHWRRKIQTRWTYLLLLRQRDQMYVLYFAIWWSQCWDFGEDSAKFGWAKYFQLYRKSYPHDNPWWSWKSAQANILKLYYKGWHRMESHFGCPIWYLLLANWRCTWAKTDHSKWLGIEQSMSWLHTKMLWH